MRLLFIPSAIMALALITLGGCASQANHEAQSAVVDYNCDNGQAIQARYFPPDAARVTLGERTIDMHIAVSADGARYVGGDRVWWTKGSGPGSHGTLFGYDATTDSTGDRIAFCEQISD